MKIALRLLFLFFLASGFVGCAATPPKDTYVIVHGAWGGGWAFKEVDDLLTADGNKVYRPTLTGQGEKSNLTSLDIDLDTHITDITNVILWENLHDVVLVGHSYGGMVITGVADRVPDRIKCLIYLDALLPENGESFNTAAHGAVSNSLRLNTDRDGYILYNNFDVTDRPLPHDVPMPPKTFSQPIVLKNQDAVKKIPATYVQFTLTFAPFYDRAAARGWNMMTLDSDHNAQWSHPQQLAALLEKAAAMMTTPTGGAAK
ncbi:MAG TPA: alpha/beta fold hydrolase [Opitutales bacterium]|jgi:pimeloyl-ACP methyl ester carboxylesterase|nr:alpha/beta fold hydrolase [Opitutales bacterium]